MGLTGYTSFTLTGSGFNWSAPGCTRYSDGSGRQDTNWRVFTGYWVEYNDVSGINYGNSNFGVTSRFTITTDAAGCSNFSWNCSGSGSGIYWAITTSTTKPSSGSGTAASLSGGVWRGSTSNAGMLPNSTYYLWIWNNHSGCRMGDSNTLSVSGSGTYGSPGPITAKVSGADITSTNMGNTIALGFASATSGGTYDVSYSYTTTGGSTRTVTLQTGNTTGTYNWATAATDFDDYITGAKSVSVTVSVVTKFGGVTAGTATKTITLNFTQANAGIIAASGWITLERTQTTAASSIQAYVQNYSKVTLALDTSYFSWPSGIDHHDFNKWTVKVGNLAAVEAPMPVSPSTQAEYTSGIITQTGTFAVVVTAYDARGFTQEFTQNITVYEYNNPSGGFSHFRCNSSGTADDDGEYINISLVNPGIIFSSINNLNTITIALDVAIRGSGNYAPLGTLTNNTSNVKGGTLQDLTYDVRVTATDALSNSVVLYGIMPSASWAIRFLHNQGKTSGAAIGKNAEYHNTFQVTSLWSMLHGDNRILETIAGTSGSAATLPSAGTYLLITSGSSAGLCGAFVIVTASNIAANIGGGANITVTVSGTNVTVTTSGGTANCHYIQLA